MEPNNFEKDFREKLNQRTIVPSDNAWDRLDAMLGVVEEKKPKKKIKWMYIAASIVGFLLVGTFFFNQKKNNIEIPKNTIVVEQNSKKDSVIRPSSLEVDFVKKEVAISEKGSVKKLEGIGKNRRQYVDKSAKKEQNQIAESSVIIKNNQELQSIKNQISISETSKKETVDQLLKSAEKSVVVESSLQPKAKVKINAKDLLNQVDGELELSFRERMITKVNKNYQTVKVAIANRNQQE